MKTNNQKGAIATILLTIVIIAAAAVAIYMYTQKAKTPEVQEGESISEVQFQDAVEN